MNRAIAVDWSGAKSGERSKIWLAEVRDGRLTRLESGRDRSALVAHLTDAARADPEVVVGLDFAFAFPRWFVEELGATSIGEIWDLAAERGEEWLSSCAPPFWGRPGRRRPKLREHLRRTEQDASAVKDSNPKSVFQIGGVGAVGTGSIRGMRHLARLHTEGFSIWPFHEARAPVVIEIYPRLLTGPVKKSDYAARETYLAQGFPEINDGFARKAASSEDAFDAAVSAMVMSRHLDEISTLAAARDSTELIEGRIWWPREIREAAPNDRRGVVRKAGCSFCDVPGDSVVAESRDAVAIRDRYPVSTGHTLVIPKTHAETLFGPSVEIQADIWRLVARVRDELRSEFNPDGFNIGVNEGQAAGQTVEHAHVHVIPRFNGDVEDPRGGIRWILPEGAAYWDR
ncbi:HIT domain-containing protein [Candidatus Palauibacter sp.]|uniref:HIT domain-containing protein n=1 Tax=Candidatus Palauibacter sp. TaxID=3101350 RepID=UPI003B02AC57